MEIRYAVDPRSAAAMDTSQLRENFHVDGLFRPDAATLTYSHVDRLILGGILPITQPVAIPAEAVKAMSAASFLQQREMGVVNIGGPGLVRVDGVDHKVGPREAIYLGMGASLEFFASQEPDSPARFYFNSAPAHRHCPTKVITLAESSPVALGDPATCNKRTIYRLLHPSVVDTCQLLMGLTTLEPGNVWNTFPPHTHDRRMEVYFYFGMAADQVVFHLMGRPDETRHIVVRNEEAVISPSWSIHSGCGTRSYSFVWGMLGENKIFEDMDHLRAADLN